MAKLTPLTLLVLNTAVACTGDLSSPGLAVQLKVSAAQARDSAAVGSIATRQHEIAISASDGGEYQWSVASRGSTWLILQTSSGRTPSTLLITLDPAGLVVGAHSDTLTITLAAESAEPVTVPVAFTVYPCREVMVSLGAVTPGVLTADDCGAPNRTAHVADVYAFSGTVGDSLSVVMSSDALDAYVIIDSVSTGETPSLLESDTCPGGGTNACVLDFLLPYTGDFLIEATTGAPAQTGSYTIEFTEPRTPRSPLQLEQFQLDSTTVIPVGSASQTSSVVLSGPLRDPDSFDELTLQVEVREVGSPFTGQPTHEGAVVPNSSTAFVSVSSIVEGTDYHWRARAKDNTGRSSEWRSFGDNADGTTDFTGPAPGAMILQFTTQPSSVDLNAVMTPAVQVSVLDASGAVVIGFAQPIDLALVAGTGAPGAQLHGTLVRTPVNGVATFDDLSVDAAGTGFQLTASTSGLPPATSATFDVRDAAPSFVLFAQGFSSPVLLTSSPGDTERVFVVEQGGRILIVQNGSTLLTPFLDISGEINSGGEQGLLGLAFDPDYDTTGRFYINHTGADGDTRVVRYNVSANADAADAAPADTLLTVQQPFSNHNGGHLTFGPDGMLYVALGDGGSGGDPQGHGQNLNTLLGNILRLDVSGPGALVIPADNPFVSDPDARSEIWISGVRNPWRFSFDRSAGDLYVADVGQSNWEEVTVQVAGSGGGENFGWNVMEGFNCFQPATGCSQAGLTLPVIEYSHDAGCSITGGYVYRGPGAPGLVGHYLYSDYCSGWVRSFRLENGQAVDEAQWTVPFSGNVTSFGEDEVGSLYVVLQDGRIYRIE